MRTSLFLTLAVSAAAAASATAQTISFTGAPYAQNFDTLPQTTGAGSETVTQTGKGPHALSSAFGSAILGVDGWYGANTGGSGANTEYRAQDGSLGSSGGRGVISFGAAGSSDRALGALSTSNQINSFGVLVTNNTGGTLTSFSLAFTGEQWRRGNITPPVNILSVGYGIFADSAAALADFVAGTFTDIPALGFTSPNGQDNPTEVGIDGNNAANQVGRNATVDSLNWLDGQVLLVRFLATDFSGQDDGLAVDNLTFNAVPEPSTIALGAGLAALAVAAFRRRR